MVVTFLHGLGQTSRDWAETAARLPESVTADCIDLFSLSSETSYPTLYHALEQHCGTAPLHLCGLSLGAVLALQFAAEHGQQVQSLALIAPQYKMPRFLLGIQNLVFRFLPEKTFAETGLSKQDVLRLTASMAPLDFRRELERISCPVLLACGEQDRANQKAARELAERIPGAALHLVDGAGHEVNKDAPEALAALLTAFYKSIGAIQ